MVGQRDSISDTEVQCKVQDESFTQSRAFILFLNLTMTKQTFSPSDDRTGPKNEWITGILIICNIKHHKSMNDWLTRYLEVMSVYVCVCGGGGCSRDYLMSADTEDRPSQSWVLLRFTCGHGHCVSSSAGCVWLRWWPDRKLTFLLSEIIITKSTCFFIYVYICITTCCFAE